MRTHAQVEIYRGDRSSDVALDFLEGLAPPSRRGSSSSARRAAWVAVALAASALYVGWRAKAADKAHPPEGRFIEVDGVRLHYIERGEGTPLVIFHGNGSLIREIELSGLVDLAARHYRVLVFDRPGFGYSERPDGTEWTPAAQASLFAAALQKLGVEPAVVVGHSWGTLVALAFAIDHPEQARALVLLSGYYFRTLRPDAFLLAAPSWPVIGPIMRYTTSPLASRMLWPLLERVVFGPPPTPVPFRREIEKWRLLRPSRLGSAAAESGMLMREAGRLAPRYHEIGLPVTIIAGERDRLVSLRRHAERLHYAIRGSRLVVEPGMGHMLHHNVPRQVMREIDRVAGRPPQATVDEGTDTSLDQRIAPIGQV